MITPSHLSDPAVRAFVTAVNAGDQAAFEAVLTPDATMSDDGSDRDLAQWADKEIFSSGGRMRQAPTCPPFRPGRFGDGERLLSGRAKGAAPREARRSSSSKRRSISASRASSSTIRSACRSTKSARVALSRASRSARFIPVGNHADPVWPAPSGWSGIIVSA